MRMSQLKLPSRTTSLTSRPISIGSSLVKKMPLCPKHPRSNILTIKIDVKRTPMWDLHERKLQSLINFRIYDTAREGVLLEARSRSASAVNYVLCVIDSVGWLSSSQSFPRTRSGLVTTILITTMSSGLVIWFPWSVEFNNMQAHIHADTQDYRLGRGWSTSSRQISLEFLSVKNCPWTKNKIWFRLVVLCRIQIKSLILSRDKFWPKGIQ